VLITLLFLVLLQSEGCVDGVFAALREEPPDNITPLMIKSQDRDCRSVSLTQANVIGFFSVSQDLQSVQAQVLYRQGSMNSMLRVRLIKEDAEVLRSEIDALLRKLRTKPLRFHAALGKEGECEILQISE
jgi:hypothetical protein